MFVSKFPIHLLTTILSRGDNVFNPDTATFAQWCTQARSEMKNSVCNTNILRNAWPSAWQVNSSYKSNQSSYKPTFGQRSHQSHHTSHRSRNDETVPMDVDVVRKAVTTEQKAQYRKEGRCFKCKLQGHTGIHHFLGRHHLLGNFMISREQQNLWPRTLWQLDLYYFSCVQMKI